MSRWLQLWVPWQKLRGKHNGNHSQNHHENNGNAITQTTTTTTTDSVLQRMTNETSQTSNGMIITDDVAFDPILDFEAYSDTIVKMIMQSHPKFSIGIYGEWGTGKTTLMKVVEDKLKKNEENILTVWFNAWRYEREDQFAIVALLKTIGYAMGKHTIYKELKPILLNAVKIIGRGFLSEIASKYIGEKGVEEFKTKMLPKMEFLSELDKDTIYFDGIHKIENEMRKIMEKYPSSRVVVFIDDLDRCSPKKALEVFESIKVFLGLDGFVYVVGLSHVTISKLITAEYKESGIKGEQYIKKIIQIPVILPEWNTNDVGLLIDNFLTKNLINEKYRDIIRNNSKLISDVVENNPREVKRFINNYIVAFEIYSSNNEIDPTELLLVQALNVRWSSFYRILVTSTEEFRNEIFKYADMDTDNRTAQLESDKTEDGFSKEAKIILRDFKFEHDLWSSLKRHKDILLKINNWEIYRRAAESVKEIPTQVPATAVIQGLSDPIPDFIPDFMYQARMLLEEGRYDDAIKMFNGILLLRPEHVEALNGKGMALYKQEKYREALECFEKVLKIKPRQAEASTYLEMILDRISK